MTRLLALSLMFGLACPVASAAPAPQRDGYFGDLHVHTRFSFDAFMFGTRATPDDAYRFARGEAIMHPAGYAIQLDRPLDFYAVTDHGFFLGMWSAMTDPAHPLASDPEARKFLDATTAAERTGVYAQAVPFLAAHPDPGASRSAWQEIIESAERNYQPGKLTTFIGYEYTSSREVGNLHRNVIFRGSKAPQIPYSRLDSLNPEDLWAWMDGLRSEGIEALAIPHNSNGSDGWMFEMRRFDGSPIDAAYAAQRMRNEPLVEMTQVKGTSDTHPFLSPNDEWADCVVLGPEVNSTAVDTNPCLSSDGSVLYFQSLRSGGLGEFDIWQVSIDPVVDLNGDNIVDSADMCIMVDCWGMDEPLCDIGPMPWGDGVVDVQDLIVLAERLFEEVTPVEPIE